MEHADDQRQARGRAYLDHLTDSDLALLEGRGPGTGAERTSELRRRPEHVEGLLADPRIFRAVLRKAPDGSALVAASPFCIFALAVHRCQQDLAGAGHVKEWMGPRRRVPVLGAADLSQVLADPWRRLFLTELLASYTHVASGSVYVQTPRGWRRRRFSELDPVRLASLLEVVSTEERPGIYRRLGDLALFLTGIFPDHTAAAGFGPVAEGRLLAAGGLTPEQARPPDDLPDLFASLGAVGLLERLGPSWYRLAASTAPKPLSWTLKVAAELADCFAEARRTLNVMTDNYLFPLRDQCFGLPRS